MIARLAFGPLRYEVRAPDGAPLLPWCARHRDDGDGPFRVVRVELADAPPEPAGEGAFGELGFTAFHGAEGHRVVVARAMAPRWGAALSALVAHDAPSAGCVVLHCAAVRVEGGVALLLAPGGVGKTTFARNAGPRSFAHNAVIVRDLAAWALPFAGDPHPELDAEGPATVRAVALLARGEGPGFEWIARSEATIALARASVRAPVRDPWARERFMIASALGARLPVGRLRTTRDPRDLEPLDAALRMEYDR